MHKLAMTTAIALAAVLSACGGGSGGGTGDGTGSIGANSTAGSDSASNGNTPTSPGTAHTLSCSNTRSSTGFRDAWTEIFGTVAFNTAHDLASQPVDTSLQVPLELSSVLFLGRSGSLRLGLWAVPQNGSIGQGGVAGHLIWRDNIAVVIGDGSTQNYLENSSSVFVQMVGTGINPPAGEYCYTIGLEQYYGDTAPCVTADGYCLIKWASFPNSVLIQ